MHATISRVQSRATLTSLDVFVKSPLPVRCHSAHLLLGRECSWAQSWLPRITSSQASVSVSISSTAKKQQPSSGWQPFPATRPRALGCAALGPPSARHIFICVTRSLRVRVCYTDVAGTLVREFRKLALRAQMCIVESERLRNRTKCGAHYGRAFARGHLAFAPHQTK